MSVEPGDIKATEPHEGRSDGVHHFRRLFSVWIVLAVAADLLFWFLLRKHVPPGTMTNTAFGQQFDFNFLTLLAMPVMFAVWVYMAYAIFNWRASRGGPEPIGGPEARGHLGIQSAWIVITSVLVLGLFVFGVVELADAGAGGGQGNTPLFTPNVKQLAVWTPTSNSILPVQVIAQQWRFTYRYPTFGGFETANLVIPIDTTVEFHVTSLDVIHSFWAYQLGVKADADPDYDDIAYTTPRELGTFTVRCDELCGIWHGAMFDTGQIMTKAGFESWAKGTETSEAVFTKTLPAFAYTYTPDANNADGGYYTDCPSPTTTNKYCAPYSNVETYGAH